MKSKNNIIISLQAAAWLIIFGSALLSSSCSNNKSSFSAGKTQQAAKTDDLMACSSIECKPVASLLVDGSHEKVTAKKGQSMQISWMIANADKCVFSFKVDNQAALTQIFVADENTTLSLSCQGKDGKEIKDQIELEVSEANQPSPQITMTLYRGEDTTPPLTSPVQVKIGEALTLKWESSFASNCQINPFDLSGSSGSHNIVLSSQINQIIGTCFSSLEKASQTIELDYGPTSIKTKLTINGSATDITVAKDEKLTLAWESEGASECFLSFNQKDKKPVQITGTDSAIASEAGTYQLLCQNKDNKNVASLSVQFKQAVTPPPALVAAPSPISIELKANDKKDFLSISKMSDVKLTWLAKDAENCRLSEVNAQNAETLLVSEEETKNTGSFAYKVMDSVAIHLECTKSGETAEAFLKIEATPRPLPALSILFDGAAVANSQSADYETDHKITWKSSYANTCSDPFGGTLKTGESATGPIKANMTYTFSCENEAGKKSVSVQVNMTNGPVAETFTGADIQKAQRLDLIVAIDRSGSMNAETKWLGESLGSMINKLFNENNFDPNLVRIYLLAANSSNQIDDKPVINIDSKYASTIVKVPIYIASTNAFNKIRDFLSSTNIYSKNISPISKKEILIITDDNSAMNAYNFVTDLGTMVDKGMLGQTKVSGFISRDGKTKITDCSPANQGTRYLEFETNSQLKLWKGSFYEICQTDWSKMVADLAQTIITTSLMTDFSLKNKIDTTKVVHLYINQSEKILGRDFSINTETNMIHFEEASTPKVGDTIKVEYFVNAK